MTLATKQFHESEVHVLNKHNADARGVLAFAGVGAI